MEVEMPVKTKDEVISNINCEEENRKIVAAYAEQVRKTEGYEVTIIPPFERMLCGVRVRPVDIREEHSDQDYDMCAKLAVDKFNSFFKEKLGLELEFVKVLHVVSQPACLILFYMTFEAKDLADEAKVKTYQTKVLMRFPLGTWEVITMRPKPSLDENVKLSYADLIFEFFPFSFCLPFQQGCYLPIVPFWIEK